MNPILNGLLENLRDISLNIVTTDTGDSEENDRAYRECRDSITDAFGVESLPDVIRANRTGRQLRAQAQDLGGYAPRRKWLHQSFDSKIDHHERVGAFLGPAGPGADLLPDYFHPELVRRCQSDFETGDYPSAILKAFRYIEVRVRELARLDDTDIGVSMISKAMGPKSTRIVFSSIDAEQEAQHALFRGAIGSLKNPLSHKEVEHPDRGRTLERLGFASMLLHDLDNATLILPAL